jgi:hypothetical protein
MPKRTIFGGRKKRFKRGLSKPKKKKHRRKKGKNAVTIRQKPRRKFSLSVGNRSHKKQRSHKKTSFQLTRFSDSSMFSSGTGRKPLYKRRIEYNENNQGKRRGLRMIQDDDEIYISKSL